MPLTERRKEFLSRLHLGYFKDAGYSKKRQTFIRESDSFTERVSLQGSAWNSGDSAWLFYVNCGIAFRDVPPRESDNDFPGTHCWCRLEGIIEEAPPSFELGHDDSRLLRDLIGFISRASKALEQAAPSLRAEYLENGSPHLELR